MLKKGGIFNFSLCLLGIIGTIGCFLDMYVLPVNTILVFAMMLITTILCYSLYKDSHKALRKYFWIFYIGFIALSFFYWKDGVAFILNTMFRAYESNSQYTFQRLEVGRNIVGNIYILYITLWILFTPLCVIVTRSIRGEHSYSLGFAITIPFIFSILLFTLRPNPFYFNMVLIFWFALAGMGTAAYYRVHTASSTVRQLGKLFAISGFVLILLLQLLFPEYLYIRSPRIEEIRVELQTKIRSLIEDEYEQKPGELDLRSAGNRFYINTNQLQVQMKKPQTLFLHGYSGTYYEDNRWSNVEYDRTYPMENMEFTHPFNFAKLNTKQVSSKEVQIIYENRQLEYLYTPYYLLDELRINNEVVADQYVVREEKIVSPTYQFADIENVNTLQFDVQEQQKYFAMVKDANLQVPEQIAEYLKTFTIDGMQEQLSYSDKINLIQSFVQGYGRYTLSPGTTPDDQDFVIYFLKTSKEGYCVHYATTAVMLLRYYGIPARYASGYRVDASSFVDGVAIAKDYNEHAWVEIFDPMFGWVPMEVTPASLVGNEDSENPTLQPNQTPNQTNPPQRQDPSQLNPNQNPDVNAGESKANETLMRSVGIGAILLLACLALPLSHRYRIKKLQRKMLQKDGKKAILYCGYYIEQLQDMHMDEVDTKITSILQEAKYSNHAMLDEDRMQVVEYCAQLARNRDAQSNFWRRCVDKYIHAYY